MIKKYIVLTTHGFTENDNMMSTNNMQVLGWAEGTNPPDAVKNFKKEHSKLLDGYGDIVELYEIKDDESIPVFINEERI